MSVLRQCKHHVKQQVRRKADLSVSRELLHSHVQSNDLCIDEDRGREVMISSEKKDAKLFFSVVDFTLTSNV